MARTLFSMPRTPSEVGAFLIILGESMVVVKKEGVRKIIWKPLFAEEQFVM